MYFRNVNFEVLDDVYPFFHVGVAQPDQSNLLEQRNETLIRPHVLVPAWQPNPRLRLTGNNSDR
jgi:hypothetical protein